MTLRSVDTAVRRDDLGNTRIGALIVGAGDVVARSWAGASTRRVVDDLARVVGEAPLSGRVRAIGLWAITAALTDGLLTPFDPRPATVSRWVLWGGVLVLGATAATFAEPVAAAWLEWRGRGSR